MIGTEYSWNKLISWCLLHDGIEQNTSLLYTGNSYIKIKNIMLELINNNMQHTGNNSYMTYADHVT